MLAVTQFFEDDDMAFVLDRMLSRENPMRARLASGRYFVRFVVVEDPAQRRSICNALNQWMVSSAEKATGIGSHFASSLELTPQTEYVPPAHPDQTNLFDDAKTAHAHLFATISNHDVFKTSRRPLRRPGRHPRNGSAARFRCRHQHSLSVPTPLRFLTGRAGDASDLQTLTPPWKSGALAPRYAIFARARLQPAEVAPKGRHSLAQDVSPG